MRWAPGLGAGLLLAAASLLACGEDGEGDESGGDGSGGDGGSSYPIDLSSPNGVGDGCVPREERETSFSGFTEAVVVLSLGNERCPSGLCLVNHFRGRVSCPYGQTTDEAQGWEDASVDWGTRCRVPGTDGSRPEDRITTMVLPQTYERRSSEAVLCSCRCANADGNTDDGAGYCTCPSGFSCQRLVNATDQSDSDLAGSYCVKRGAEYDAAEAAASPDCTLDPDYPGGWQAHPYQCGEPVPE